MKKFACVAAVIALLGLFDTRAAEALTITPQSPSLMYTTDYNKTIDTPEEWLIYLGITPEPTLAYKSEVSGTTGLGGDSGSYASSYQTIFSNTATDPSDALITYLGGGSIGCTACYLLVKDGNNSPAQYLFDLTLAGWNGTDQIVLSGFWPAQGAISNVAIYNGVPEPTTLGLMAVGLSLAAVRRRRAAR
jgi:hypothetical protein